MFAYVLELWHGGTGNRGSLRFDHPQPQVPKIFQQEVGTLGDELFDRRNARLNGDGADAVVAGGQNIGGGVADERDGRTGVDPA